MFPFAPPPCLRLSATSSVSHLQAPHVSYVPGRPKSHTFMHLAGAFLPFRIHQDLKPFFSLPFESVSGALPCLRRSLTLGFGYPLNEFSLALSPLEASFSSPRVWASPFSAFLPKDDRKKSFLSLFRSRAFLQNLLGFEPAPQRLFPIPRAVPLFATGWIRTGRGPCFSWAFTTS